MSGLGTIERTHQAVHIDDIRKRPPYLEGHPNVVRAIRPCWRPDTCHRAMLKENELIGAHDFPPGGQAFTEKADRTGRQLGQASRHAIENARLLGELRRTHRRPERVTAAADRDRRRAESYQPLGIRPESAVLTTLAESAKSLCGAAFGVILPAHGEVLRDQADRVGPPAAD